MVIGVDSRGGVIPWILNVMKGILQKGAAAVRPRLDGRPR